MSITLDFESKPSTHAVVALDYVAIELSTHRTTAMTTNRRLGNKTSKNRSALIEAAETVMCRDGYASVTARKVASEAGLKVQLVYYYFESMDALVIELIEKNSAARMKHFVKALTSTHPLRALWELNRNKSSALFTTEILAMANHKESIRQALASIGDEFRQLQSQAVDEILRAKGVDTDRYPATAIVATVAALSRAMAQDSALGANTGYTEAETIIENLITELTKESNDYRSHSNLPPIIDLC